MTPDQLVIEVAEFLMPEEGFRPYVYDDATGKPWAQSKAGKATIGYGHLLKPGEPLDWTVTEQEAYELLLRDVGDHLYPIIDSVTVPLSLKQWVAIVSFTFNVGVGAFKKSSFLKAINAGDMALAETALKAWNKGTVNGQKVVMNGLVSRRAKEWDMFAGAAQDASVVLA